MRLKVGRLAAYFLPAVFMCAGCASYLSTRLPDKNPHKNEVDGVVYYMPTRAIAVQVKVDDHDARIQTPSLVAQDTIPDYTKRFVLQYQPNYIGENAVKIGVSTTGLLTSAGSTATPGIGTVLENIASLAGSIRGVPGAVPPPPAKATPCVAGQTYTLVIESKSFYAAHSLCDYDITIDKSLQVGYDDDNVEDNKRADDTDGHAGIFYRTDMPYRVTFKSKTTGLQSQAIAYSPSGSKIHFLPIERTLFAKNTVAITLKDGSVTEFDQDNEGELIGLTSIPANVLKAYFEAVGSAFTNSKTQNDNANAAAISETKRQVCAAAVAANPIAGKKGADLDTAYNNIKTACSP